MMYRLPPQDGEWLDRSQRGAFDFEGGRIEFFAGDSYVSALAAAGRMTLARSFKLHRRRGLVSAANHDANALFQIDGRPNQRGDVLLARSGARVSACNTQGGVERDRGARIEALSRFLPVGFYYKTFISRRLFPLFERAIRAVAGLGHVEPTARASQAGHRYLHCDVAVVGAGYSGIAAALAADAAGAGRVVVIDEGPRPAGDLAGHPRIELLAGHCAFGLYEDGRLGVAEITSPEGGLVLVRATRVILATGAVEQPVVFRNNDLPGVILASAALRLRRRHAIACGRRVVVLTATREGATAALELGEAGITVSAVACLDGSAPLDDGLRAALVSAGIPVLEPVRPVEALAGADGSLAAIVLETHDGTRRLDCDALLLSAGWAPALQLALQGGGALRWSPELQQHLPGQLPANVYVTGRARGLYDEAARLADARLTGAAAARGEPVPSPTESPARAPAHPLPLFAHPRGKEFVDLDEDLTIADLRNAMQEGFDSPELLKRYSTVGMGPSQGKLSHLNALRLLAHQRGVPVGDFAMTTARPPYQGVTLGALAGATPPPLRRSALDEAHRALGACWMPAGTWRRPAYYARGADSRTDCIAAEVRAVRATAGLIDVSTLGKIELHGPDAGRLLESAYTGRFLDQRVGTTRYALMTDEGGMIVDDGVVARRGDQSWYVTATTTASAIVYRELQRRVIELSLDCVLHNLTGTFAAVNLAGPRSRDILAPSCEAGALDDAAFPYLAYRELSLASGPARVMRVGFVGELAYEIHVPFDAAPALWTALIEAGAPFGLRPFGVEAQRVLRLEKGHIIVGQDTDALTSPDEAGLGRTVRLDKGPFVGSRSIEALRRRGPKQQLIGFALEGAAPPFCECNLVLGPEGPAGRVTSVAWSPTLGRVVGLALVSPSIADRERLEVRDDDGRRHAIVRTATPFYDPRNERQRAGAAA